MGLIINFLKSNYVYGEVAIVCFILVCFVVVSMIGRINERKENRINRIRSNYDL